MDRTFEKFYLLPRAESEEPFSVLEFPPEAEDPARSLQNKNTKYKIFKHLKIITYSVHVETEGRREW